ncbi:MAG: Gfo/Idh/MocA family oxidoreductase [Lentisphaerae bacterium]|jgi:predicted dehydrogenase|nr:Gfo/Idh/MocA family oxidoreductase [Lentisphaerota bacterium]MBT4822509.1 Gfo/Idh/MocA family oxidoreductase [Lentisphaerota bacterium]MBT5605977.1 Gfo/Idh/MocA family oxidoreductase [Lentisphaerota bacterium]MBT7060547.1 Gfo/Idh/MocA family oxidoreductase [Lentisphaerota bacterium]MBT7848000.1 Gfo/Idh/MocA family oxidoreductase [Lentisphaerota bacterium]
MIRLGLISAATYGATYRGEDVPRTPGSFHGTAFASTYNGCDEDKAKQWEWTFVPAKEHIDEAQVVKVWDPHKSWAERLADVCYIPEVAETPAECAENVDAVVIVDDGSGDQWKYALEPLRRGIPTFCDKPIAMTATAAKQVARVVRETGTPFMSASSLRFIPDIIALREELPALGDINLATTLCGNDLVYYGIHALSMYYGLRGGGALSCINVGRPDCNIVRVRFENGCDLILMVGEREMMRGGYQLNLFGTKGWRTLSPDLTNLYLHLQRQFIHMLKTGDEPVPVEEEVEVIAVLEAGKRSLQEGREVTIAEVLGD